MQVGSRVATTLLALAVALAMSASAAVAADFTVVNNATFTAYVINGHSNPTLTLVRGQTYTFDINAVGHPFWVKLVQSAGTANAYEDGVTTNGETHGLLTFAVPLNAPSLLFYNCAIHPLMTGTINIVDALSPTSTATRSPSPTPTQTRTPTISPSPTPTATPGLNSTPTPTPTIGCVGDCNGGGSVTVDEVVSLVTIAAGDPEPSSCPHGIPGGSPVDLTLLVEAVTNALSQCATGG